MKSTLAPAFATALLLAATSASALVVPPPQYTLTYNAADGSLVIDTFDAPLFTYSVKSLGASGDDDGFIELNHDLLPNADGGVDDLPFSFTSEDDELSQSDVDGWDNLGQFSLGEVLQSGLDESEFNAILDSSVQNTFYVDQLGAINDPESYKAFDIVYNVPEPGSIVIFGIGAALLVQRRRTAK